MTSNSTISRPHDAAGRGEGRAGPMEVQRALDKTSITSLEQIETALENRGVARIQWPIIRLNSGEVAWVPFGHIPFVTSQTELADTLYIPWMTSALGAISEEVQDLVFTSWSQFLKQVGNKTPWKDRMAAWKEYRAAVTSENAD